MNTDKRINTANNNGIADIIIIGIGNRYRGDDALGCLLVDQIRDALASENLRDQRITNNVAIIEHDGEPAALIDCWQGYSSAILIDAVSSGATAGSLHRINLQVQALPDQFRSYSTHAFGIAEAVELARVLGKLPPKLVFYGVEGESFAANTELSDTLKTAAVVLQQQILHEIDTEKNMNPENKQPEKKNPVQKENNHA